MTFPETDSGGHYPDWIDMQDVLRCVNCDCLLDAVNQHVNAVFCRLCGDETYSMFHGHPQADVPDSSMF